MVGFDLFARASSLRFLQESVNFVAYILGMLTIDFEAFRDRRILRRSDDDLGRR